MSTAPVPIPATTPSAPQSAAGADPTVLLGDVIKAVTGLENPSPRPGQVQLLQAIHQTMLDPDGKSSHVGVAPTGTGKAIAGLVPAALAACRGQRTLFSTESLALQSQIIDKDFPVVADACQQRYGVRPTIALKKGFNNYVCLLEVFNTIDEAVGEDRAKMLRRKGQGDNEILNNYRRELETNPMPIFITGKSLDLLRWALSDEGVEDGDKSRFQGEMTDKEWESCSTTSDACPSSCPLSAMCPAIQSRRAAEGADIVVTNHTLMGIQAASNVPVLVKQGNFHHVIIDEAHALPGWVRSQGEAKVDQTSLDRLIATVRGAVEIGNTGALAMLLDAAGPLQQELSQDLLAAMPKGGAKHWEAVPLENKALLPNSREPIQEWCKEVAKQLREVVAKVGAEKPAGFKVLRAVSRVEKLGDALTLLDGQSAEHMARWLTVMPRGNTEVIQAQCSPVDVGPLLRTNLWAVKPSAQLKARPDTEPDPGTGEGEDTAPQDPRYGDDEDARWRVNVVAMSATLPLGFNRSIGLPGKPVEYASPFTDAYAESVAFIPRLEKHQVAAVSRNGRSLDVTMHRQWAKPMIEQLVAANGGRALVLAATASNGKEYVDWLRQQLPALKVYSQWDGGNLRNLVAAWRDDTDSVLVGTRSLMTGVDAPGDSCSLVILDRIPRSPSNPVDDARVEALVADDIVADKWEGDRLVYVADARLLMEQACGRLIRAVADRGMVAVLDPRLLADSRPVTYQPQTRKMLVKPLQKFGRRTSSLERALELLERSRTPATVG